MSERKKKLQQLAFESSQRQKQVQMHSKLTEIIPWQLFSFMSPSESGLFTEKIESWPDHKWKKKALSSNISIYSTTDK